MAINLADHSKPKAPVLELDPAGPEIEPEPIVLEVTILKTIGTISDFEVIAIGAQ